MPIYSYECTKCMAKTDIYTGPRGDLDNSVEGATRIFCAECGGELRKVVSNFNYKMEGGTRNND